MVALELRQHNNRFSSRLGTSPTLSITVRPAPPSTNFAVNRASMSIARSGIRKRWAYITVESRWYHYCSLAKLATSATIGVASSPNAPWRHNTMHRARISIAHHSFEGVRAHVAFVFWLFYNRSCTFHKTPTTFGVASCPIGPA